MFYLLKNIKNDLNVDGNDFKYLKITYNNKLMKNKIHVNDQQKKISKIKRIKIYLKNVGYWTLVPIELISACFHISACCGCCGTFGNPITPVIDGTSYIEDYPDTASKCSSGLLSGCMGTIRSCCCLITCSGCFCLVCSPREGISLVKYE